MSNKLVYRLPNLSYLDTLVQQDHQQVSAEFPEKNSYQEDDTENAALSLTRIHQFHLCT